MGQQLEALIGTLFTYSDRKNLLAALEHYYEVINAAAAGIKDHHEKQQFLKVLYENFYKVYNPKMADRLGVVYTPNEIVRFMIRSTDQLLHRHFGKTLSSRNVEILDPATGTGTFLTDIIDHIPKQDLDYKYKNEMHANEVAILPYYVANLNIEYTFKQKMGYYAEFPNLCFVDTLDNTGALQFSGKQEDMFGLNSVNATRIKNQNSKKISVIIGNPPYNANQQSENDNNKNRTYTVIDKRIKETYIKHSTAQKTKVYDMYARFLRWASDRIEKKGIVAFVSNNSFIDSRTFDGFRAAVKQEFNELWMVDLRGNARSSGEERRKEGGNVFSDQIRVGIAVYFLIRNDDAHGFKAYYTRVDDYIKAEDKKEYLRGRTLTDLQFQSIEPDKENTWINHAPNDWADLLPLINKDVKLGRPGGALFKLFSLGVVTARDEWVYDKSKPELEKKVKYLVDTYNHEVTTGESATSPIKWSRSVKKFLTQGRKLKYAQSSIISSSYRPFGKEYFYFDKSLNEMQYKAESIFGTDGATKNLSIIYTDASSGKPFMVGVTDTVTDYHYVGAGCAAQLVPLFGVGQDGTRHDNLTDWGLAQFNTHYGDASITKEEVFHYVYAVLHDPVYREKYALNLKREFPRIPFYADFRQWAAWGKQLMDLHIGYEKAEPYPLELISSESKAEAKKKKKTLLDALAEPEPLYEREFKVKVKLKADKVAGIIELDELTLLKGIPAEAWNYKLGNRSALEWVLDQYKEKKPKDPTIREKFNTYRFADYKEQVIDLLKRVTTVSVGTMEVVSAMERIRR
ncbi:MAG: N-6 DNA methylase, partial [Bacteroidota bacterium]|nr:N-6 DNA methylase [Bacteroidota bacterium]